MIEVHKSNKIYKKLLFINLIFSIILIAAVAILSYFLSIKPKDETKPICTTPSCIRAANSILKNLNQSIDPCEDFYEFSCGSFSLTQRIPEDLVKINEFSILRDNVAYAVADLLAMPVDSSDNKATANAKKLYFSCMNEDEIEKKGTDRLLEILNEEFAGWPILQGDSYDANAAGSALNKLIALKKVDSGQLFEIYVALNPKDPRQSVLRVSQPSWFFNKEYLLNENIMRAYKTYIATNIRLLDKSNRNSTLEIDAIFEIEKTFGLLQIDEDQKRNSTYKNMTIRELQEKLPLFEWKTFIIDGMYKDIYNLTENERILVDDWNYLLNASILYSDLSNNRKRDFHNFLVWLFVKDYLSYLPKVFLDAKLDFDKVYQGNSVKPKRSLSCSNYVNSKMENAVGKLYVSKYFNKNSKLEALDMVSNLLDQFKKILNESDWMDLDSKKVAIEKANFIDAKIGYSESLYNDTNLEDAYKHLNFSETEFLENNYKASKTSVIETLSELRKEQNTKDWISGPAVVNAFYSPPANQICFPAGILQAPFYDLSYPKYMNYGGIGTVIGHEITHGFDDMGRLYDKNGVYYSDDEGVGLWTNKTIENYKKKVECMINQYNGYVDKQVNKSLNGINTQGENIADNGGIKESFRAYKIWSSNNLPEPLLPGLEQYNQEQLFFINFAQLWCGISRDQAQMLSILNDVHATGQFRVIGATSNSEDFARAFRCKRNTKNNPENKCSVW